MYSGLSTQLAKTNEQDIARAAKPRRRRPINLKARLARYWRDGDSRQRQGYGRPVLGARRVGGSAFGGGDRVSLYRVRRG